MTLSDAAMRIAQIQNQVSALDATFAPGSVTRAAPAPAATPSGAPTFASALASAQADAVARVGAAADTSVPSAVGLGSTSGAVALPNGAIGQLTRAQQTFAARLAQQTGLDPGVVSAWLLAEESGGAAQSRESASNNDWLNIGYTDSGTYGASDPVWSDPTAAADATAGWLKGQNTIPGYGTASTGIQAILETAGQPPGTQIAALQHSGWASSGYPSLPALYAQVAG